LNIPLKILLLLILLRSPLVNSQDLTTLAEKTQWRETGDAREVEKLCAGFEKKYLSLVKCSSYGVTPEGRRLMYLSVGKRGLPVLWVQAGIHAGEIDGKDATFQLLRDLLAQKIKPNPLEKVRLIFVPTVNLDGHERRGKWNRPNQVGPEEMGWRTTAQNLNLNRDFAKVEAPEMQSLLKLWHQEKPLLSLDLHVTNGAQFEPELGLVVQPHTSHGGSALHKAGLELETALVSRLKERSVKALPFYPVFEVDDDPSSGFSRYVASPKFSHGYWAHSHRLGVLVEAHSWKDYARRVQIHYQTVLASLELLAQNATNWEQSSRASQAMRLSEQSSVPLSFKTTNKHSPLDFAGYHYEHHVSSISGSKVIRYDPKRPMNWRVPFYEELVADRSVVPPTEGYVVSASEAQWLKNKFETHAIKFSPWKGGSSARLQVFRAQDKKTAATSLEGRQALEVKGEWREEQVELAKGSLFVPLNQPQGRLIMQLLEPTSPDSYLAWGFMNRFFEQKEYMENYVIEDVAQDMLKDPLIKREFEARLKETAFAKDPEARFEFFYRRHPSWDQRYNRYPIFRR
jgi:hypothetical protein